ncbi:beta-adaptin 4 [Strigomonas culicis]|uniref:AP complex subunit beta n=1 Tax=Strigomonas culicis TaxID=28005 RepID=S9UU54_9TRYP|nr:beta-adaptin 4 [Strigomonas culicis]EPY34472.1 beta-adaptin 4 [Strigomonas culicis]|eukprot:EPY22917.1 beta-adaptin 4 [Strigomonas culicis]
MSQKQMNEINDLRGCLRDPIVERDDEKRRFVLRRVIALMTTGVDTSPLFAEIVLALSTTDTVSKKLIYFYLTANSDKNIDMALMTVNTFVKECSDPSPVVRGLALRSLSLLQLPQLLDFFVPVLDKGLQDSAPYVRQVAVMCSMRVYILSPQVFRQQNYYNTLQMLLRDNDTQVCFNAVSVLLEITKIESENTAKGDLPLLHEPFIVQKPLLYYLINRIPVMSEWQRCQVMRLILQYNPSTEEEIFNIMNVLEPRLYGNNSGLILACCSVFLHLTENFPNVYRQVYERIRQPLLALVTATVNVEASYAALCHVKLLVKRHPLVFRHHYKSFFANWGEPSYITAVKIDILVLIADARSVTAILEEFRYYSEDRRNRYTTVKSIEGICKIGVRLPELASKVIEYFIAFLDLESPFMRGVTLTVSKDFFRAHRQYDVIAPFVSKLLSLFSDLHFADDASRIAFVWILGEFGEHIDDAPYILEALCANLSKESTAFRLQMLTSATTLFFKRPPEMQPFLGQLFDTLLSDYTNADVLDRALFYYRLLRENPFLAAKVIYEPKQSISLFAEDEDTQLADKLFEEFDTFSVIYGVQSREFTAPSLLLRDLEEAGEGEESEDDEDDDASDGGDEVHTTASSSYASALQRSGTGPVAEPVRLPTTRSASMLDHMLAMDESSGASLCLRNDVEITTDEFQLNWDSLGEAPSFGVQLKKNNTDALEDALEDRQIYTLASGSQGDKQKYYMYAMVRGEARAHGYILLELIYDPETGYANVTLKCNPKYRSVSLELLHDILATL